MRWFWLLWHFEAFCKLTSLTGCSESGIVFTSEETLSPSRQNTDRTIVCRLPSSVD